MKTYDFTSAFPEIIDKLQATSDRYLESYDEHKAFVFLIAELFETTMEDKFQFTDGPKDGGIDFVIRESQAYSIFQCKCPSLDNLMSQPTSYDMAAVDELMRGIKIITDRKGEYDIKPEIKRLRGDYQRDMAADPKGTTLTATLAVLGELTNSARKAFNSYKASLRKELIFLKLVEWHNIYHNLHALEMPSDVDFEFTVHFDSEEDLLAHKDYCYVLAHADDFYDAFRQHEWNLFEWNVRFQIPNSPVNKRIVKALMTAKGRKLFHHYNNGLLITCRHYKKDTTRKRIILKGPQIVNGCQTVRAICEAYEDLSPEDQQNFRDKTRVQVKIIQTIDADFIGELVISTNDQNPMNPRNLKSNTPEQRDVQKLFRNLPAKWFLERKDGEFKSLLTKSTKVRWFRRSDYAVDSKKKFRVLDNQELAKAWFSFIGFSNNALRGGINYFADEGEESIYTRIFKSIPTPAFWSAFRHPNFVPNDEYYTSGVPSVYQYLISWGIASYIDYRRISFKLNKQEAVKRGIESGSLKGDLNTGQYTSTAKEVDEYLMTDLEYFLTIMLNNMREILIELFSFILVNKYTECSAQLCQDLITKLFRHNKFFESACDGSVLSTKQDGTSLIGPIYDFLKDCAQQYFFKYEAEIKAAPRLKSYLAQRATINRYRAIVLERNQSTKEYDVEWKEPNKTFIESLPNI